MIEAFNAGDMAREEELFQKAEGLRHYQNVHTSRVEPF